MTDNKLADALRIAMEWNWLDDDARPSRVAEICDDALAEHDAKADGDYVLVPRVPTEAMFDAGVERHRPQNMSAARLRLIWDAMLSAAPVQPPANGEAELPPLPLAFFDEFGRGADDRVQDYARAAIAARTCPLPEHWRMAIKERGIENPKALDWIEQRARELAQEGE